MRACKTRGCPLPPFLFFSLFVVSIWCGGCPATGVTSQRRFGAFEPATPTPTPIASHRGSKDLSPRHGPVDWRRKGGQRIGGLCATARGCIDVPPSSAPASLRVSMRNHVPPHATARRHTSPHACPRIHGCTRVRLCRPRAHHRNYPPGLPNTRALVPSSRAFGPSALLLTRIAK